jgi:hypothetical protein
VLLEPLSDVVHGSNGNNRLTGGTLPRPSFPRECAH